MKNSKHINLMPAAMLMAVALVAFAPVAHAQSAVTVTVSFTGDAYPGDAVAAMATVDIGDGSTVESYAWTQTYGVEAMIEGADTANATVTLGTEGAYKGMLIHVLEEPPITADQLPPNVPVPEGEFHGGLQNRFEVIGANPFALEETALVALEVTVVTSSGTYYGEGEIHTMIPWKVSTGLTSVPVGAPVLFNGKEQASYDWAMTAPDGSSATLMDATMQYPEFTPDVAGMYEVMVTDMTDEAAPVAVNMYIYAGTWRGIIVGQDADGRPMSDPACTGCHSGFAPDKFTPWAQTGHAEIFTNSLNTNTHYGENCFACHTVGFDPDVDNGGIDEASDYQAFLDSGLINNPGDNWTTLLEQFPETAKRANVQCENCHGPQTDGGHDPDDPMGDPRNSISSDLCATCHGEPLRHARFQQWQLSPHANYELALDEGDSGSCSRCHTGNGFLAWLPVLTGEEDGDVTDSVEVTWTSDQVHPQTCQTCHDPHMIGDSSGNDSNATVRISGDTPMLLAGFTATDVGRGAICMTCHNTRRGLRNDSNWDEVGSMDAARAPHGGAQSDVMMGENAYFVAVGMRGYHSNLEDTCATCHMESTPPPDDLAYNGSGTNHTFYASPDICADCHTQVTADSVQSEVMEALEGLGDIIEADYLALMEMQIAAGNSIDFNGAVTVSEAGQIAELNFAEYHGRQSLAATLTDGTMSGDQRLVDIDVVPPAGDAMSIDNYASDDLLKAGWNWNLVHNDGSTGVHNPGWVNQVLAHSTVRLESGTGPGDGGTGPGVACTSMYTYWTEIAAHAPGNFGSVWRTDVAAQNLAESAATLQFILHTSAGNVTLDASVDAMAQGIFEDIVGLMGVDDKGALEICSDMPLDVVARVYNQTEEDGTFGQFIDGLYNLIGLGEGQSAKLLGLRQMEGVFRTNISVTNTGLTEAMVGVTLYGTDGTEVGDFELTVGAGMVVQKLEPFVSEAQQPNLGWGFATVEVMSGSGILTSASVVDSVSNDATTIPMKR